jgi:hypothetical protein
MAQNNTYKYPIVIAVDSIKTDVIVQILEVSETAGYVIDHPRCYRSDGSEIKAFYRAAITDRVAQLYFRLSGGTVENGTAGPVLRYTYQYKLYGRGWFVKNYPTFKSLKESDFVADNTIQLTANDELKYPFGGEFIESIVIEPKVDIKILRII